MIYVMFLSKNMSKFLACFHGKIVWNRPVCLWVVILRVLTQHYLLFFVSVWIVWCHCGTQACSPCGIFQDHFDGWECRKMCSTLGNKTLTRDLYHWTV